LTEPSKINQFAVMKVDWDKLTRQAFFASSLMYFSVANEIRMMKILLRFLLISVTVIVAACTDDGREQGNEMKRGTVFFEYRIWGEEGKENVTCLMQFRMHGPNGTTFLLKEPANVKLDGEIVKADSAKLSGAYYEIIKPVNEFEGEHSIVFTDAEKQTHKTDFEFAPFRLLTELPESIQRKAFTINLANFSTDETPVHVTLTDTAFATNDVNEIVNVVGGKVEITSSMLNKLKAGPIVLEIFKESTNLLVGEKGSIWTSYGLRREFELAE
jgi:hypothetical protein